MRQPIDSILGMSVLGVVAALAAGAASAPPYRVDVAGMDRSVAPGNDFYEFANGGWMKSTEIPPDRSAYGSFTIIDEEVNRRLRELLEGGEPATASMAGRFYAGYMDEAAIEKRGLEPVKRELDEIAKVGDRTALARVLGSQLRADVDALNRTNFHTDRIFGLWAAPDFAHPERYVGYLLQGGLGMPDRDNYRKTDDKSRELQSKYRAHIGAVLATAKVPDAEAPRRPDLRPREEDRRRSRQPDRLGRRPQGGQSLADGGVPEARARARLEGVLRRGGPLRPSRCSWSGTPRRRSGSRRSRAASRSRRGRTI